jgi:hypothetical protein
MPVTKTKQLTLPKEAIVSICAIKHLFLMLEEVIGTVTVGING